jgi:outer membrane protein TolC
MIGARNSREYQTQKEIVFESALNLDLEMDQFRNTWFGMLNSALVNDEFANPTERGFENSGTLTLLRKLENGTELGVRLGFDLAKLLTLDKASSWGHFGDATVSIPLLRGSGEFVVTEPLTQADRDVIYAIYGFERFKRVFSVDVATAYLGVLEQRDIWRNTEEYYRRLVAGTRSATRRAQAGDLPEIQVDQVKQDELQARDQWVLERAEYERRRDALKLLLGLPTDADVALVDADLEDLITRLTSTLHLNQDYEPDTDIPPANAPVDLIPAGTTSPGPLEIDSGYAVITALENRLDLRTAVGQVFDGQRVVAVAADNLRADLTLLGSASLGARRTLSDAGLDDAHLRFDEGIYSAVVSVDLPFERTQERNLYRQSIIRLEQSVRNVQSVEDTIKFEVRDALRTLLESRESLQIQAQSIGLAVRRVRSTTLFLQAGRADVRDVLEAQEDLLDAQNAFTFAIVRYRIAELSLQRDLGLLDVDETGLWQEFRPGNGSSTEPVEKTASKPRHSEPAVSEG